MKAEEILERVKGITEGAIVDCADAMHYQRAFPEAFNFYRGRKAGLETILSLLRAFENAKEGKEEVHA